MKYLVYTKDKGLTTLETFSCRTWVKELCENRIFKSIQQLDDILLVVDVSKEAYERGLGCPADARNAFKFIESLPKFKPEFAVVTSKESGKAVYDTCKELAKQGRILTWGKIEDPHPGCDCWMAEVVCGIKEV